MEIQTWPFQERWDFGHPGSEPSRWDGTAIERGEKWEVCAGEMPSSEGQEGKGVSKTAKTGQIVENQACPRTPWSLKWGGSSEPEGVFQGGVGSSLNAMKRLPSQQLWLLLIFPISWQTIYLILDLHNFSSVYLFIYLLSYSLLYLKLICKEIIIEIF